MADDDWWDSVDTTPVAPPRRATRLGPGALLVLLALYAVALWAVVTAYFIRGNAMVECDIGNGFFQLQVTSIPLVPLAFVSVTTGWLVCLFVPYRTISYALGIALSLTLLWFSVRAYLSWTAPPADYPVSGSCFNGLPRSWPSWLPGPKAPVGPR
ncbi:hypothetical protein GB931_08080 [Modestobacter sp. I12A-02628]|uniref:Uncharacterized protein n=1 Tax=Goekera deserti TaxID=2497753 RepID=A0A7K3WF81_9ACTN|nr:hypothetical protein [Goekera deserti]MPQ97881.1 hypothetical protein [Goekera deserti]NDI48527.1 hypothetical protein [Goekera deserti]NEL55094.1 hypothetical protein [Goekera deserti]